MPASAAAVFDWHARPAAFFRLIPPWERVEVVAVDGPLGDGQRVTLRAGILGPVAKDWVAELFDVVHGRQFRDRELTGPFAHWQHTHSMHPTGLDASDLTDDIEYRLPFGRVGQLLGGRLVRSKLAAMFAYRHALTASDLRRHARFPGRRLTVAVTGSNGVIGSALCHFLAAGDHAVRRLVRTPDKTPRFDGTTSAVWNPAESLAPALLDGVDAVVHLAGDGVADGRWTPAKKARIRDSRVGPTRHVAEAAARAGVRVLVSGSAVGIYGNRGDEELDESSRPGDDFLAGVCREWEAATLPAEQAGVRVVHLRTGVVLTPRGGALAAQLPAFQLGGGAVVGTGRQWVSWVTIGDQVGAIHHGLMTDTLAGPVNVAAPHPVTNRDFGRALATALGRPYLLTVPAPVLRLLFGELADAALLASARVLPRRLTETGFAFDHPDVAAGLRFVLGRAT